MAHYRDSFGIDVLVSDEIIHRARDSPSPGGDRSAIIRWIRVQIKSAQTFRRIRVVGLNVAMIKSGHGIAAVNRLFERPHIHLRAPSSFGRLMVSATGTTLRH